MDGLWLDMNEPRNFCNGSCDSPPPSATHSRTKAAANRPQFDPNDPPYWINNQNSKLALNTKTIDMDAIQYGGVPHYNAHSIFGEGPMYLHQTAYGYDFMYG